MDVPDSILRLLDLIAPEAVEGASALTNTALKWLAEKGQEDSAEHHQKVFLWFLFLQLTFMNGTWSHLQVAQLRSDLLQTSLKFLSLHAAAKFKSDEEDVEALAAAIEATLTAHWQSFLQFDQWTGDESKDDFGRGAAIIYPLNQLQREFALPDPVMIDIHTRLSPLLQYPTKVEELALQMNIEWNAPTGDPRQ